MAVVRYYLDDVEIRRNDIRSIKVVYDDKNGFQLVILSSRLETIPLSGVRTEHNPDGEIDVYCSSLSKEGAFANPIRHEIWMRREEPEVVFPLPAYDPVSILVEDGTQPPETTTMYCLIYVYSGRDVLNNNLHRYTFAGVRTL